jgi:hypothetical protein
MVMIQPQSNRRPLYFVVLLSLLMFGGFAWLMGGVEATPYSATDSQGRTMGFNDVFSAEHYGLILDNAGLARTFKHLAGDDCWFHHLALLAAHVALLFFLAKSELRTLRIFLWCQPVIFFWGWLGFWILPIEMVALLWAQTNTRESFIDIPYVAIMSQGAWFLACAFVLLVLEISRLRWRRCFVSESRSQATASPSIGPITS